MHFVPPRFRLVRAALLAAVLPLCFAVNAAAATGADETGFPVFGVAMIVGVLGLGVLNLIANRALRKSRAARASIERQLGTAMDAYKGYFYVCSPDMKIKHANQALREFHGGDPVGLTCHEVLFGQEAICPWCPLEDCKKLDGTCGGEVQEREFQALGDRHWFHLVSTVMLDDEDQPHLQNLVEDITESRNFLEKMRSQRARFRKIINENADALFIVDHQGIMLFMNPAAEKFFGRKSSEMVGNYFGFPMDKKEITEIDIPHPDGTTVVAEMRLNETTWENSDAYLVSLRDMTDRKRMEERIRESEQRYRIVADYTHDWEMWFGIDGAVQYISPSCERICGFEPEKFTTDPTFLESIIHRDDVALYQQYMGDEDRVGRDSIDFRFFRKDGRMGWLSLVTRKVHVEGKNLGIRAGMRDITDRKLMETELRHQALHDPLTGLANRTLLRDRVRLALERSARRDNYYFALVFMDLDRFKVINDSLGHAFGDKLLKEVCSRLIHCVRGLDTVSRYGGDEFVLLLEELDSPREAIRIVKRVRESIMQTINLDGHDVKVTASFGVFLGPTTSENPQEIIQNANIAMHYSKEQGRDRIKVFTAKLLEQAVQMLTLEHDMRRGIPADEFEVYYQPIVSLEQSAENGSSDAKLIGFEALVRWNHPDRGLISPGEFIPTAEESGLIVDLGQWVLHESCRTMAQWRRDNPAAKDLLLSVNISGKQFSQISLVDQIRQILSETGFPPDRLKLEITETAIMDNADFAIDKLNRLKLMGISISIDDFGTGYSSMSHLQRFPLDHLKIDLSFVQQMDDGPENQEIVRAIVNLAHNLNLKVIAEGVETDFHRQTLSQMDCEYGQGYLFSRPIPSSEAGKLIGADITAVPPDATV